MEKDSNIVDLFKKSNLVIPGQKLCTIEGLLAGPGTFEENGFIYASVAGISQIVNKLIYISPLGHGRYIPNARDIVVGRIDQIYNDRWNVDIRSFTKGHLPLSSIILPNNEQRKRSYEDALDMRKFYQEGDYVVLEVHRVSQDGTIHLLARNAAYGTLKNGSVICVPQVLVQRQPHHMVKLECGVFTVLGMNGMIWVGYPNTSEVESLNYASVTSEDVTVSLEAREKICRVRNSILGLAATFLSITIDSINFFYDQSRALNLHAKQLLDITNASALGEAYASATTNIKVKAK